MLDISIFRIFIVIVFVKPPQPWNISIHKLRKIMVAHSYIIVFFFLPKNRTFSLILLLYHFTLIHACVNSKQNWKASSSFIWCNVEFKPPLTRREKMFIAFGASLVALLLIILALFFFWWKGYIGGRISREQGNAIILDRLVYFLDIYYIVNSDLFLSMVRP